MGAFRAAARLEQGETMLGSTFSGDDETFVFRVIEEKRR